MPLFKMKYHHECWSNPLESLEGSRLIFKNIFNYSDNRMAGIFYTNANKTEQKRLLNIMRTGSGINKIVKKNNYFFIIVESDFSAYKDFFDNNCIPFPDITINEGIEELRIFSFSKKRLSDSIKKFGESLNDFRIIEKIELASGIPSLTAGEKEAFDLALRKGYFEIPRKQNLEELADELGIKKSAINERLRKAQKKILQSAACI